MKKTHKILLGILGTILLPVAAYAIQITVPSAPANGYLLVSKTPCSSNCPYVATTTLTAVVLPLQDTAANLASVVPLSGELVYETDTKYTKIGDGVTTVANLVALTSGQWSVNGSKIYYSTDNVGIGTSSPYARLSVEQGSADINVFAIGDQGTSTPIMVVNGSGYTGFGVASPTGFIQMTGTKGPSVSSGNGPNSATTGGFTFIPAPGRDTTQVTASSRTGGTAGDFTVTGSVGGLPTASTGISTGGVGSSINLTSGNGGSPTVVGTTDRGGTGGAINITAGTGGIPANGTAANTGGNGGSFTFTGGAGGGGSSVTTGGNGSSFQLIGGAGGNGTSTGGVGGNVVLNPGNGGAGTVGASSGQSSGQLIFQFAQGGSAATGGDSLGLVTSNGTGGSGTTGNGGAGAPITLTAGNGGASSGANGGSAGNVALVAGDSGTGGTRPNGGNVYVVPGLGTVNGNVLLGINSAGTVIGNVGIGTTSPYASLSVVGASGVVADHYTATGTVASTFTYASSTMESSVTASTTNFYGASLISCNTGSSALTWTAGAFGCNSISGGNGAAYPFTPSAAGSYNTLTQATSGTPWFQNGLNASTTSHFVYASTTAVSATSLCLDVCKTTWPTGTVTSVTAATPNSTLTLGGTNPVTTSGTINFDLNLGHANIWTGLQTFTSASSTSFSSLDGIFIGRTATTTIRGDNQNSWFQTNYLGVGTTTPQWLTTFASSTAPQMTLVDGAGIASWAFRNKNGTLYLATTSPTTFATTTPPAMQINSTGNPSLSIATTSTSKILNLGPDPSTTNASSTIRMQKLQWEGLDSGGTMRCTFINASGALTTISGACN